MRLAESGPWPDSVMTDRRPPPKSTRSCRSEGLRISISTKAASVTRHGAGTDEVDIQRCCGCPGSVREISQGIAFPSAYFGWPH